MKFNRTQFNTQAKHLAIDKSWLVKTIIHNNQVSDELSIYKIQIRAKNYPPRVGGYAILWQLLRFT